MSSSLLPHQESHDCHTLAAVCPEVVLKGPNHTLTGITANSQEVRPGMLFAALSGSRVRGSQFIVEALAKGAVAILHDGSPLTPPPWL
ncbi:MAG: Mur ligase domain-containing protein [Magnetococcus sp. DMHC-6]